MKEQLIQRAYILLQQQKYAEAGKVLKDLLAQDPNDVQVLAMMSDVFLHQDKSKESLELINSAIGLAPQLPILYFKKARVLLQDDKDKEAEACLKEAIELDPSESIFFSLWAMIKLDQSKFEQALDLANQALELDPADNMALNVRSKALLKLKRTDEAYQTIDGALGNDPNNPFTHSTYGWNLLESGDHKKALEHFREALKIDPNFTMAQQGMAQALKARYLVYRGFLKYHFWMSNMAKYQWFVIIGIFLLARGLDSIADNYPVLAPFLTPLLITLSILVFSTWVITPLSNLFLRLNPYGKHLLKKNEIRSSNFVGLSALTLIAGLIGYFATSQEPWLTVSGVGLFMMPIYSTMFSSKRKWLFITYAIGMTAFGLLVILGAFASGVAFSQLGQYFIYGYAAYLWISNLSR